MPTMACPRTRRTTPPTQSRSREPLRGELDEYEDFGNRRLRTVGELIQEAFRVGLYRMERVVRERMTTEDVDTITPQTIINIRPVVAALKEFFGLAAVAVPGPDELAAAPHTPAPPVGAWRRRPHARARADRGARRPSDPLRRMCPIETPEGPNIGLIGSLAVVRDRPEFGFIQTPYRNERQGDGRHRLSGRGRGGAVHDRRLRAGR